MHSTRSLRMQVSPTTLDPTFKGIEVTPERGLYARVPCAVFIYTKIGRKTRSVIGALPARTVLLAPQLHASRADVLQPADASALTLAS